MLNDALTAVEGAGSRLFASVTLPPLRLTSVIVAGTARVIITDPVI